MRERIIMVNGPSEEGMANLIVAQVLCLASDNAERAINMYISSPGGVISAGLGIYDTMRIISCPVATTCVGYAASFGTILLLAGDKGRRRALPNARIHMHQDRKSTRLNSSHSQISYAVFCLKKKKR